MSEPIVNIASLVRAARKAALNSVPLNDACPYPFYTDAGQMFKQQYLLAVAEMEGLAA